MLILHSCHVSLIYIRQEQPRQCTLIIILHQCLTRLLMVITAQNEFFRPPSFTTMLIYNNMATNGRYIMLLLLGAT